MRSARAAGPPHALVSAFAFGGSGPVAKPLEAAGLDPLHVTWLRIAGAALVLLPVAVRHLGLPHRRPLLVLAYGVLCRPARSWRSGRRRSRNRRTTRPYSRVLNALYNSDRVP